ncbi:hypothetical protein YC2023_082979 [Brassica napus]
MMDEALRVSDLEVCTACVRAEQAEKEDAHLKSKAEARSLCESDLASRQASAIPYHRSTQFAVDFEELKNAQKNFGDHRSTQFSADNSYDTEMARMSRHMGNYAGA